MRRLRILVYAAGLIASPLLLMTYWLLYPAYGDVHAADIVADIGASPARAALADVFAFAAVFLAVPGTLAYLRVLIAPAPRLSRTGATLALVGWIAVLPLLMTDVAARELTTTPDRFDALYSSTAVVALSVLATLHVVGGALIGLALFRTRLVPRPLGVAAVLAPVIHLTSNLAGLLWVDVASWLVAAAVGVAVLPRLTRLVTADEAMTSGEQGGRRPGPDTDLGVHVLDVV